MIDSHAHIYLPEFDSDREQIIQKAVEAGVQKILLPAVDNSTHESMLRAERDYPICVSMIGLHPCSVKENYLQELNFIDTYLNERKFIAIGEIGLDFYWDKTFILQQYEVFHQQISIALKHDLPIAIHSRNATDECIEVIEQYPTLKGVFHCFSGSLLQAKKIINRGFFLGIGGVVTFKNSGIDQIIKGVGIENVILETDAPYLAPVPFRGKRNEPANTRLIAEKISLITGINIIEVNEVTTRNTVQLFNL